MGRNFNLLNCVQFLDALNENLFKYIVVYFLIFYQGRENASLILSITGAVFVLPFLLFSPLGGCFADRVSKTKIIQITRLIQIGVMGLALLLVFYGGVNGMYLVLFADTTLSALFGPSKYGIISEIVPERQWLKANGSIAAFTFFGIIFGTALASALDTLTGERFPWMIGACLAISLLGASLSYFIAETKPASAAKPWPRWIYKEISDALSEMSQKPLMLTAVFCYGYLLFMGAFIQMNIIPYSVSALHRNPAVGGYLFLFSSVGVCVGSLIAARLSGRLNALPWAVLGMSAGCFLFTHISSPFWINIVWLIGVGIFGGLVLVPSQAFILSNSRPENKGRNFATANFFSFVFALFAAGVLYVFNTLLSMSPQMSFTGVGILNAAVATALFFAVRPKKVY
ncbi:MAG: MFS transporter [Chlamydiales bacterium]